MGFWHFSFLGTMVEGQQSEVLGNFLSRYDGGGLLPHTTREEYPPGVLPIIVLHTPYPTFSFITQPIGLPLHLHYTLAYLHHSLITHEWSTSTSADLRSAMDGVAWGCITACIEEFSHG